MLPTASLLLLATIGLNGINAHPGHDVAEEAMERAEYLKLKPRTIRDCAAHLERRGHSGASVKRRQELAHELRAKRGLTDKPMLRRRDFSNYDFSHQSTDSYTLDTDESTIFADNSSCTLQSEVTQGPYYVNGELIRQDVTEGQSGIPLYLDIQVIDTSTCEPVSDVYMDLWHCNATGVYSGVVANGNGDSSDTSNLDNTALRGIQQTDSNGLVQFQTLFPGHYSGRATHIHIMTHNSDSTTKADNDTLTGTTHASHVGQLFFDQSLIEQADTISPYSTNDAVITANSADSILGQEADTTDPFVEYVLLGDSLSDGLLAWISIGIDPTADNEVQSASTNYADGGVSNGNSMGGGPGGDSGSGGPPSSGNGTMSGGPGGSTNGTMSGGPGGSTNGTMSGGPEGNNTMSGTPDENVSGSGMPSGSGSLPSGTGAGAGSAPTGTGADAGAGAGFGTNTALATDGGAPSETGAGPVGDITGVATGTGNSFGNSNVGDAPSGTVGETIATDVAIGNDGTASGTGFMISGTRTGASTSTDVSNGAANDDESSVTTRTSTRTANVLVGASSDIDSSFNTYVTTSADIGAGTATTAPTTTGTGVGAGAGAGDADSASTTTSTAADSTSATYTGGATSHVSAQTGVFKTAHLMYTSAGLCLSFLVFAMM